MCTCANQIQPHDRMVVCPPVDPPVDPREIHDRELDELREQHWRDHGGEA